MLEVIHLSKKYDGQHHAARRHGQRPAPAQPVHHRDGQHPHSGIVRDDIGFTVPDGRIGILLGPNGAGKSTVIKSIAGLLRFKGTIRIQGQDRPTMGSSSRITFGRTSRAQQMLTFCIIPLESSLPSLSCLSSGSGQ